MIVFLMVEKLNVQTRKATVGRRDYGVLLYAIDHRDETARIFEMPQQLTYVWIVKDAGDLSGTSSTSIDDAYSSAVRELHRLKKRGEI